MIFAYMSRELGEATSAFVREHIRRCAACQAAAAEMQSTVDAMRAGVAGEVTPQFDDLHRERITRAVEHPWMDWVERHRMAASLGLIVLVLAALVVLLKLMSPSGEELDPDEGITVTIGVGAKPAR